MKTPLFSATIQTITRISLALFFVSLPVTSFPFLPPAIGGGAVVRPLLIYPLIVLMLVATIPRLFTSRLPRTFLTLLPFILVAGISSLFAFRFDIETTLGVSAVERLVRAYITLGLGVAIYLTVSLVLRSPDDLRFALRWLYTGFGLALLWGSLQAVYVIQFSNTYFQLLSRIQRYISIRRLFTTRISGMTYEPNWFAEQLSFLLIPWLLAAVLTGYSAFKWRWRGITVELILLIWSILVLPLTFSRAGLIVLVVVVFFGVIFLRPIRKGTNRKTSRSRVVFRRVVEATVIVVIVLSLTFTVGARNEFFSRIWNYWIDFPNPNLSGYFEYLGFGARIIYAETALRIYDAYPVFGVGIGNYAFFFEEMLPREPISVMPEVLRVITPGAGQSRLITSKNLYFRLLSETGLIGMAAFFAFIVAVASCALFLWLARDKQQKYLGTAGLLGLVAFVFSAFTFDSFALPNMWVVFGLITAAAWMFRQQSQENAPAELSH